MKRQRLFARARIMRMLMRTRREKKNGSSHLPRRRLRTLYLVLCSQ